MLRYIDRLVTITEVTVDLYNAYSNWDAFWENRPGMKLYPAPLVRMYVTHAWVHSLLSLIAAYS